MNMTRFAIVQAPAAPTEAGADRLNITDFIARPPFLENPDARGEHLPRQIGCWLPLGTYREAELVGGVVNSSGHEPVLGQMSSSHEGGDVHPGDPGELPLDLVISPNGKGVIQRLLVNVSGEPIHAAHINHIANQLLLEEPHVIWISYDGNLKCDV